jgi:cyclophilin family peptidyl-prolyl cis-trans isomerase
MINRRRGRQRLDDQNTNHSPTTKLPLSSRKVSYGVFFMFSFCIVIGIVLSAIPYHQLVTHSLGFTTKLLKDNTTSGITVLQPQSTDDATGAAGVPNYDSSIATPNQKQQQPPLVECTVLTPQPLPLESDTESRVVQNVGTVSGTIRITVRQDLSPIASQVFLDLVTDQYFDGVFIFRVLKGFVAQWGFRGENDDASGTFPHWRVPLKTQDSIHNRTLSNIRGTLSFAGGNPATRQVFVNLGNNQRLDKENSRPFATLDEDGSMNDVLDHLYTGYKDGQGQISTINQGEEAVRAKFPRMSMIEKCRVVKSFSV